MEDINTCSLTTLPRLGNSTFNLNQKEADMILILGTGGLLLLATLLALKWRNADSEWFIALVIFGVIFALSALMLPISRISTMGKVAEFNGVRQSIEVARESGDSKLIESAAIQMKVAEMNGWLAEAQYWAKNPLTNWYWPGAVLKLTPIR
jgi:uncharacterized protein YhaN